MKQPKCKVCNDQNPSNFPKGKKNLCKKCKNEQQNIENQKNRELLTKIKSEELKPETPRARSSSPSQEVDITRQEVISLLTKQAQDFELYKFNLEAKIQALESQIQALESRPIIINQAPPEPLLPVLPEISKVPSPIRSKSPNRKNYDSLLVKVNDDNTPKKILVEIAQELGLQLPRTAIATKSSLALYLKDEIKKLRGLC